MITIKVFINEREIFTTSAVNKTPDRTPCIYQVDNGREILHERWRGAKELGARMLLLAAERDLEESGWKKGRKK